MPVKKACVLVHEVKAAQKQVEKLRAELAKEVAAGKKAVLKARAELKKLKEAARAALSAEKAATKAKTPIKAKTAKKPAAKKAAIVKTAKPDRCSQRCSEEGCARCDRREAHGAAEDQDRQETFRYNTAEEDQRSVSSRRLGNCNRIT